MVRDQHALDEAAGSTRHAPTTKHVRVQMATATGEVPGLISETIHDSYITYLMGHTPCEIVNLTIMFVLGAVVEFAMQYKHPSNLNGDHDGPTYTYDQLSYLLIQEYKQDAEMCLAENLACARSLFRASLELPMDGAVSGSGQQSDQPSSTFKRLHRDLLEGIKQPVHATVQLDRASIRDMLCALSGVLEMIRHVRSKVNAEPRVIAAELATQMNLPSRVSAVHEGCHEVKTGANVRSVEDVLVRWIDVDHDLSTGKCEHSLRFVDAHAINKESIADITPQIHTYYGFLNGTSHDGVHLGDMHAKHSYHVERSGNSPSHVIHKTTNVIDTTPYRVLLDFVVRNTSHMSSDMASVCFSQGGKPSRDTALIMNETVTSSLLGDSLRDRLLMNMVHIKNLSASISVKDGSDVECLRNKQLNVAVKLRTHTLEKRGF